jgi:hypothetical protein
MPSQNRSHISVSRETSWDLIDLGLQVVRVRQPAMTEHNFASLKLPRSPQPMGHHNAHKPVIWVHVHKSAGTIMCLLAQENGEAVVQPHANCNRVPFDDNHRLQRDAEQASIGHPDFLSCAERGKHLGEQNYTWAQIERPIESHDFCRKLFFYGIALRDPLDIAESILNYDDRAEIGVRHLCNSNYKECLGCLESGDQTDQCKAHIADPSTENLWVYFDNFLVRNLGGKEIMNLPPGGVTSEHAELAIQTLNLFDLVTLVEDIRSPETHHIFEAKFGWSAAKVSAQRIQDVYQKHTKTFSEEEKAVIHKRNEHDYRVYNHFKAQLGRL